MSLKMLDDIINDVISLKKNEQRIFAYKCAEKALRNVPELYIEYLDTITHLHNYCLGKSIWGTLTAAREKLEKIVTGAPRDNMDIICALYCALYPNTMDAAIGAAIYYFSSNHNEANALRIMHNMLNNLETEEE